MQKDESILSEEMRGKMVAIRELRTTKSNLKAEIKSIDETLEELNAAVTDFFESQRIQSMKLEGVGNFYLNRALYPSIEDREACYAWLKNEQDFEGLLTFNTNKFKAYYKERLEEGMSLPEGVKQFFKVDVRVRKV